MKVCGLITEYNPFHNGHIHHIEEAKKQTGADYLIVVMSGNYVQRGTPTIIDKYERTRMALDGGVDLVLELPCVFSTGSAEVFATAAVNLLYQLGCVDSICFGSECGSLAPLKKIAELLNNETREFSEELRNNLKAGLNYPTARSSALDLCLGDEIPEISEILDSPNNILGIEYLRAIAKLNAPITPVTIKRWATEYHGLQTFEDVASATAIRKMLYEEDGVQKITPYVTPYTAREFSLKYGVCTPIRANDFSAILQYRLETERDHLSDYYDFAPELADRVNNLLPDIYDFKEWASALKSKSYTHTRINRALLHLILNITEEEMETYKEEDYCMYARILGFRESSAPLLSEMKNNTALPIISKMADAKNYLNPVALRLLEHEVNASNMYRNIVYQKYKTTLKGEYSSGIIKL